MKFYEDYVIKSEKIYLMMNLWDESRKQKLITRMNEDFNLKIIPEYPVTRWPNYLIVGEK